MNIVRPGDILGKEDEFSAGRCTYVLNHLIYSAVLGQKHTDIVQKQISVNPYNQNRAPASGDACVAQVTYVTKLQIELKVLCVESQEVSNVQGIIRANDKNKQKYHLGDYVLCKVLTVSERAYLLSTKEEGLGIIDIDDFVENFDLK